jgi:hypothetical protein
VLQLLGLFANNNEFKIQTTIKKKTRLLAVTRAVGFFCTTPLGRVFLEKITGYELSNSSHFDGDIKFTTCVLKPTTCPHPDAANFSQPSHHM